MTKKEEEQKRLEKMKRFVADLKSTDMLKFKGAIEGLKLYGDATIIPVLANLYSKSNTEKQHLIIDFLTDIRSDSAQKPVMEAIQNSDDEEVRIALLSTIWGSANHYEDYLKTFVGIAIKGSLRETIECHTIIENMVGPFDENVLMDAKVLIRENVKSLSNDAQKSQLLSDILLRVNDFDREIEEE